MLDAATTALLRAVFDEVCKNVLGAIPASARMLLRRVWGRPPEVRRCANASNRSVSMRFAKRHHVAVGDK
ncbi:hypothetical protein [Bradyrhizobium sp. LA6.10]|uniref:hypothetical protein n=1 Tax=Bradyrhizobium sp. LA6.10 TaxID=3156318 RepID=UPI003396C4C6